MEQRDIEEDAPGFWQSIIEWTLSEGTLTFPKAQESGLVVPRPEDSGFLVKHVGELKGQLADWRASLDNDQRGFHAVEYEDRFECHIDHKDPFKDPLGHLVEDSPGTLGLIIGGIAVAGLAGGLAYYYRRKPG